MQSAMMGIFLTAVMIPPPTVWSSRKLYSVLTTQHLTSVGCALSPTLSFPIHLWGFADCGAISTLEQPNTRAGAGNISEEMRTPVVQHSC